MTHRRVSRTIFRVTRGLLKLVVVVVACALVGVVHVVLPGFSRMADSMLGYTDGWDASAVNKDGLDLDYSKADYDSNSIKDAEKDLDEQISAEGYVLLRNEGGALPLPQGTTVSLFSEASKTFAASQNMMTMVTGSGSGSYDKINSGLENAGLSVNKTLQDMYQHGACKDYAMGPGSVSFGDAEDFRINECPLAVMQESGALDSAQGTTPLFIMKRVAGEGRDMPRSMYNHASTPEDQQRSYLEPDSTEREILSYLNDNFDNTILVVNTASALQLDWLADYPHIRAVISMPSAGTEGMNSFARILTGAINPSGRTVDTWSGDIAASPVAQNFGDYQYVDSEGAFTKYNYVSYAEGIYVGYRYYETRYEDFILGQGNPGTFDYEREVVYPFGHGLSYTTFQWSSPSLEDHGDRLTATVTVTNTGDVSGKDVVELYAQQPYTDANRANGIEKSSVDLVGYAKTAELAPGQSQTVTISFERAQLTSYDSAVAQTYVLDPGTYYVTPARDAHAAVNNILAAKGKTQADGMDAAGDATMALTWEPGLTQPDTTTYATDPDTGVTITNQFDDARGDITYLTRADWTGTFPSPDGIPSGQISTWGNEINGTDQSGNPVSYTYTKIADSALLAALDGTDSGNPAPVSSTQVPVYGADNGVTLADLRGAPYDDPRWEALLDQLTPEDYDLSIARAGYGSESLSSVGKPFSMDADTAAGLIYGGTGWMFPTPVTVAQTWNQELASEYGTMIGNEALLGGANGWYAPSMNIHRSPYSGRNGEYYSEDPFLSGVVARAEVRGATEKGMFTTIKHFALNDQENHRGDRKGQYSIATWSNEQAIRQIYLQPFNMVMKEGNVTEAYTSCRNSVCEQSTAQMPVATGIMTGFNRIGATWTGGSYALLTKVVRDEWGFNGWILTDNANTATFMGARQMLEAGGDSKLTTQDQSAMWTFDKDDPTEYALGRQAMHHLLFTVANSHAMDGSMPGATLKTHARPTTIVTWTVTSVATIVILLAGWTSWRNHLKYQAERKQRREAEQV